MKAKSLLASFFVVAGGVFDFGVKHGTYSRAIVWASMFLTLALAPRSYSDPLPINILDAQYTTVVDYAEQTSIGGVATNFSRTMVSPVQIGDSLYNPVTGQLSAQADAGQFGISAYTAACGSNLLGYDPFAQNSVANATSELWFSPLTSQTTTINIQISAWNQWQFTSGTLSLLDVTSGNELWNYWWGDFTSQNPGTVPWVITSGGDPNATATLQLDTSFNASDTYILTMNTVTASNPGDSEQILVQLSGLEPVPEPSTVAFLGLGLLALARVRRRR